MGKADEQSGRVQTAAAGYTPQHLQDEVLSRRSALQGEHKCVTVLFADIVDSVELSRQIDAEDWHDVLDRFFQILNRVIHRFEGTVNQYTGDGVMALFGAPQAQELHASRACFAARALQDNLKLFEGEFLAQYGLPFGVRIGLNSGDVVVGKIGDELRKDYTAQGHVVGLASRMERLARPGSVYLTAHTAQLARPSVEVVRIGEEVIRGSDTTVEVYELLAVHPEDARLADQESHSLSRFVGRASELHFLRSALDNVMDGCGQSIAIVGDAGLGKSRLCLEFEQLCRDRDIPVHRAHGVDNGQWLSVYPTLTLMRSYLGIHPDDEPGVAREKIRARLLPLGDQVESALPRIYEYLGVPEGLSPAPEFNTALRSYQDREFIGWAFHRLSQQQCSVLILDDLHWFDESSLEIVKILQRSASESRILLILTYRPNFDNQKLHDAGHCSRLALNPLTSQEAAAMIQDQLGPDENLQAIVEHVARAAEGNPFFIEELLQSLHDRGVITGPRGDCKPGPVNLHAGVPARVHNVIAARVDGLDDATKDVLQAAAVVGRDFSATWLQDLLLMDAATLAPFLERLCRLEFISQTSYWPQPAYRFKHNLTHTVVYDSLLRQHKRELHAAVAAHIARTHGTGQGEFSALLAAHREAAGQFREAAQSYHDAAEWSVRRDVLEAMSYHRKVIELSSGQQLDSRLRVNTLLARIALLDWNTATGDLMPDAASRLFEDGCAIAQGHADCLILLGRLYGAYAIYQALCYDFPAAVELSDRCAEILGQTGQSQLQALAEAAVKPICYSGAGMPRVASPICKRGLDLIEQGQLPEWIEGAHLQTWTKSLYAMSLADLGQIPLALRMLAEVSDTSPAHTDTMMVHALGTQARFRYFHGEIGDAVERAEAALELAEKIRGLQSLAQGHYYVGMARIMSEDWDAAHGHFKQARELSRRGEVIFAVHGVSTAWLAQIEGQRGHLGKATQLLAEALALGERRHNRWVIKEALMAQARILLWNQGAAAGPDVQACLKRWSACLDETGSEIYRHMLHMEAANLAELRGEKELARQARRQALDAALRVGAQGHAKRLRQELAR